MMSGFGYHNDGLALKALLESSSFQTTHTNLPKDYKQRSRKLRPGYNDCQYDIPPMQLGPSIWDKTLDGNDVKLEYMDLDEFLLENGIPVNGDDGNQRLNMSCNKSDAIDNSPECSPRSDGHHSTYSSPPGSPSGASSSSSSMSSSPYGHNPSSSISNRVDFAWSDSDIALVTVPGQDEFDPTERVFSLEELKPQPMMKKSRKIFIADEMKDDRYWCRRKKNNVAAKRSRDARRIKENQVAMRAGYLEKENISLKVELEELKEDNLRLKQSLKKYEPCL